MSLLEDELHSRPAWVLSIIGAGGSGKTSKSYWILDNWFPDEEIFAYRFPPRILDCLPDRMSSRFVCFDDFRQIAGKPGIVFLDDVALSFLSRSSHSSAARDFISTMTIARHNGWRFLVTTQNSILTDKGLSESLDQFSLRSRMTSTQTATERDEVRPVQEAVNEIISEASNGGSSVPFSYCPETDELFKFPDWPNMTEGLSKPFKGGVVVDGQLII